MSFNFHVITPLARYENVFLLKSMLETQNIIWHLITDDDARIKIEFNEEWIKQYVCPNSGLKFYDRCNNSINWFIETQDIVNKDVYCFMNDDDGYYLDFFKNLRLKIENLKMSHHPTEVIICSMERGHNIPDGLPPERRHPPIKLYAHPSYMHVGGVGIEQIFMSGKVLKENRLPLAVAGDGMMISDIVGKYPTSYLPELSVLFNYLEPGRWNK